MISQVQLALREKLQHELQQEQVIWYAYPDPTRRAKQARLRSPFPWWIVSRIILLLGMLIVVICTSILVRSMTFLLIPLYGGMLLFVVVIWMVLMVQRRSEAAHQLSDLPQRIAFVRSGEAISIIHTDDIPLPVEPDDLRDRLALITQRTRDTYCRPKYEVEAAINISHDEPPSNTSRWEVKE